MKTYFKNLFPKFLNWIVFGVWFIIILWAYSVYSAYSTIAPVTTWQILSTWVFNNLISNIEDLNNRITAIISTWSKSGNNVYYTAWNVWIWNNNPQANLDVSWTVKMFGNRTNISVWTIYQAPSDGFVLAFGRADWTSWFLPLTLMWWWANPPTSELWVAYSYNNAVNRSSNFQLTIPIKKWEYYQLLCGWLTACPAPFFIWMFTGYFVPMWN